MKPETITVEVKADTRQAMRSIRRVGASLWWMQYGVWALAVLALALAFAVGVVVGLLLP